MTDTVTMSRSQEVDTSSEHRTGTELHSRPRGWLRLLGLLMEDILYAQYLTSWREAGDHAIARELERRRRRKRKRRREENRP